MTDVGVREEAGAALGPMHKTFSSVDIGVAGKGSLSACMEAGQTLDASPTLD